MTSSASDHNADITVLVVEDDAPLRRLVRRQLSSFGYRVLQAEDAASALQLLAAEPVDVLFTDVVMPGPIDGFALARTAATQWPTVRVLLTSGYPGACLPGGSDLIAGVPFLPKPYRTEELKRAVSSALDEPSAPAGDHAAI